MHQLFETAVYNSIKKYLLHHRKQFIFFSTQPKCPSWMVHIISTGHVTLQCDAKT